MKRGNLGRENLEFAVPEIKKNLRTQFFLVMNFEEGVRIDDFDKLEGLGIKVEEVYEELVVEIARQIVLEGKFHADPNLGNFRLRIEDGKVKVIMLDTGHVMNLNASQKAVLKNLIGALIGSDSGKLVDGLEAVLIGKVEGRKEKIGVWFGGFLEEGFESLEDLVNGLMDFCNKEGWVIEEYFVQILKTLGILGRMVERVDKV